MFLFVLASNTQWTVFRGANVIIANRTPSKAEDLAKSISSTVQYTSLRDIQEGTVKGDILANTTSVGMHPNVEDTPIPKEALENVSIGC